VLPLLLLLLLFGMFLPTALRYMYHLIGHLLLLVLLLSPLLLFPLLLLNLLLQWMRSGVSQAVHCCCRQ
jgi:hypothetical protein